MSAPVLTPITQALNDGALTRKELKTLMRRSDGPAARRLAIWALMLLCTGSLVHLALDTWAIWPAMLLHGIVLVHHFALQHECVHYTPFKTRWLNDVAGNICGFIIGLPHQFFRYEHCDHHTHTQVHGEDPELIALPRTIWGYLWFLSSAPYWWGKAKEFSRHIAGRMSDADKTFVPKEAYGTVFREARIMAGLYAAILAVCVVTGWWGPLWFWWLPVFLGEPVMRFVRLAEHVGRRTCATCARTPGPTWSPRRWPF